MLVATQVAAATWDPCRVVEGWRTGLAAVAQGDLMEVLRDSTYRFHRLSLKVPLGLVSPSSICGVSWRWRDSCFGCFSAIIFDQQLGWSVINGFSI